jgi:hypothetical protein
VGAGDPSIGRPRYDRALLLLGPKRDDVLTLRDVRRYGTDSFGDPDYLRLYGMTPAQWYARGIRLLGRTAVECTRDDLARAIAVDVAAVASPPGQFTVVDPFAGSCNTLYWILRKVPASTGVALELDGHVHALTARNITRLDRPITLLAGDSSRLLEGVRTPADHTVIAFVAPPWGTALDESTGLDLRRTTPPITEVVAGLARRFAKYRMIYAIQVYERVEPRSLAELRAIFGWSALRIYDLDMPRRRHGILLGTPTHRPDTHLGDGVVTVSRETSTNGQATPDEARAVHPRH